MTTDKQAPVARHWIDGHWCDSAKHQDSLDPATGEKIGSYAVGGADEATEAVAAALRAFRETDWKQRPQLLELLDAAVLSVGFDAVVVLDLTDLVLADRDAVRYLRD